MRKNSGLWRIIEKHRALDGVLHHGRKNFVSDWNGSHPFVREFLGAVDLGPNIKKANGRLSRYAYFDDEPAILDGVRSLHQKLENLSLSRTNIIGGPGSSSLLVAFSLWLLQQGYDEVCYVPPLYYTFHYFLRTLSIRVRPVAGKHLFETGAALNLPARRSVLLLCDPIWFAGRRLSEVQIEAIAGWQRKTGSLVFVDGSFQFTQWDGSRRERTASLDPDLTFRLISPTKSLAIPAFRFAYLLLPDRFHAQLLFLYESMVGGVNITDLAFARRALNILAGEPGNRPLMSFFQATYEQLAQEGIIQSGVVPECGYFAFAVPTKRLPGSVRMDQEYFELKRHPNHVRINLMVAAKILSGT